MSKELQCLNPPLCNTLPVKLILNFELYVILQGHFLLCGIVKRINHSQFVKPWNPQDWLCKCLGILSLVPQTECFLSMVPQTHIQLGWEHTGLSPTLVPQQPSLIPPTTRTHQYGPWQSENTRKTRVKRIFLFKRNFIFFVFESETNNHSKPMWSQKEELTLRHNFKRDEEN
jgi:hypothetical protein